jgi:hypothetical protein
MRLCRIEKKKKISPRRRYDDLKQRRSGNKQKIHADALKSQAERCHFACPRTGCQQELTPVVSNRHRRNNAAPPIPTVKDGRRALSLSNIQVPAPISSHRATQHQPLASRQALPHRKISANFWWLPEILARPTIPRDRPSTTKSRPTQPPSGFSPFPKLHNSQNGSRIRLELAPAHLRQGRPLLVRKTTEPTDWKMGVGENTTERNRETERYRNADGGFTKQPRLHPLGRSDPQVRPQHLPSVLPREGCRHWLRQGTHDPPTDIYTTHPETSTSLTRKPPHSTGKRIANASEDGVGG